MTLVVTSASEDLDVVDMVTLNKEATPRTRELKRLGIVNNTVGAESVNSRPYAKPLVPKERRGSHEKPQPSWEWAGSEEEQRDWKGFGHKKMRVREQRYLSEMQLVVHGRFGLKSWSLAAPLEVEMESHLVQRSLCFACWTSVLDAIALSCKTSATLRKALAFRAGEIALRSPPTASRCGCGACGSGVGDPGAQCRNPEWEGRWLLAMGLLRKPCVANPQADCWRLTGAHPAAHRCRNLGPSADADPGASCRSGQAA